MKTSKITFWIKISKKVNVILKINEKAIRQEMWYLYLKSKFSRSSYRRQHRNLVKEYNFSLENHEISIRERKSILEALSLLDSTLEYVLITFIFLENFGFYSISLAWVVPTSHDKIEHSLQIASACIEDKISIAMAQSFVRARRGQAG